MLGLLAPLEGMQQSAAQFNHAAANMTRATIPGLASGPQDLVDLSTAAVALIESRNSFEANTKVFKIVDAMSQALINMLG